MQKTMTGLKLVIFSMLLFLTIPGTIRAQTPASHNAVEIYAALQKLNTLGSALYIAAHPDDENTRLIAYLANQKNMEVTYLSLTRGDGGQNLLGPEMRELLGVIRTQELLQARSIDGGNQFFSRANDFGYSKSPGETLQKWGKREILSDVVWAIRKFQPDIIINRFPTDTTVQTHGHHTASAILSAKAFELAGQAKVFPKQLQYVEPWQPKRLFFNTSWFFYSSKEAFQKTVAQNPDLYALNIGTYYPLKGRSNTEISAQSRSMHRSQGFGTAAVRGRNLTYLQLLKGESAESSIFEGIDMSWSRIEGGEAIGRLVQEVIDQYQLADPAASIPGLLQVYQKIKALPRGFWKNRKLKEVKHIIRWCAGLFLEAATSTPLANPGENISIKVEATNRSEESIQLQAVQFSTGKKVLVQKKLETRTPFYERIDIDLPEDLLYSSPYWLRKPWSEGRYTVEKQTLRGLPETPEYLHATFQLLINGIPIHYTLPIIYSTVTPAQGEIHKNVEIAPPVSLQLAEEVYVFSEAHPKTVKVTVTSHNGDLKGKLRLEAVDGWEISPATHDITIREPGEKKTFRFTVTPPEKPTQNSIKASIVIHGKRYDQALITIDYTHIPSQIVLEEASAKIIKMDLEKRGDRIAYIMGAGDEIPASLEQIGYEVDVLNPATITLQKLQSYDALITGVRAYNTVETLKFAQPTLFEYVRNGGTMIVQYNKTDLVTEKLAPYPLEISHRRVTEEDSPVTFLAPEHPLLNFPNEITQEDFEGWVQERGLYFPSSWDEAYTPVLAAHDTGEPPRKGGLLVARYGKGYFIYTGYSWFRELPAGIPGAFKLFTNMISIGHYPENQPNEK